MDLYLSLDVNTQSIWNIEVLTSNPFYPRVLSI